MADRVVHLCRVRKVEQAEVEVVGGEAVVQQAAEAAVGPKAQRSDAEVICCRTQDVLCLLLVLLATRADIHLSFLNHQSSPHRCAADRPVVTLINSNEHLQIRI